MQALLPDLIFIAGIGQLGVLIASSLVPFQLNWREELRSLKTLHWQMYLVYGGYVVLSIIAFGLISIFNSQQLADGSGLSRGFCLYVTVFWGIRLLLQGVFDVKEHLTTWWLKLGYHGLTVLFLYFTFVFGWVAFSTR
jgi:alginate O-acetyltransferase complex protein AlgI